MMNARASVHRRPIQKGESSGATPLPPSCPTSPHAQTKHRSGTVPPFPAPINPTSHNHPPTYRGSFPRSRRTGPEPCHPVLLGTPAPPAGCPHPTCSIVHEYATISPVICVCGWRTAGPVPPRDYGADCPLSDPKRLNLRTCTSNIPSRHAVSPHNPCGGRPLRSRSPKGDHWQGSAPCTPCFHRRWRRVACV